MNKTKAWFLAARPKTLAAAVCPVVIGTTVVLLKGQVHWMSAFCALMAAVFVQIGANFANDYFDFKNGADTQERTGPARAVQSGWLTPGEMKRGMWVVFGLSLCFGAALMLRGGWPIVGIGVASILCALAYTGGPFPYGYKGLGEVFVLLFFGPVAVAGTAYVQSLQWDPQAVLLGISPGLFSVAILAVNNIRDREEDAKSGKKTLAVRMGENFGRWEYNTAINAAVLVPYLVLGELKYLGLMIVLLPAFKLKVLLWQKKGEALNPVLAKTGLLLVLFTALFVGISALTLK